MPPRTTKSPAPADLRDNTRGVRLQKALNEAGIGSRRQCEAFIEDGRVAVNGQIVTTLPAWTDPKTDRITFDEQPIRRPSRAASLYLMVYKPRGVICTNRDPEGRRRIIDLVPHPAHLFCVGRLDSESNGLVLLTNDGDLANQLTHPRYEVPKTYRVTVKGLVDDQAIARIQRGLILADKSGRVAKAHASAVRLMRRDRDRSRLQITLREGRNREIRRMLARLGFPVKRLTRIAIGKVRLKGLASGEWRELTRAELTTLREAAGLKPKSRKRPR